ncbi:hypothetical protein HX864_26615 [Pseudomonas yamanorum]|jgi:hypothetical protein|uniref:hypothetical protein n=1 Tax=Pseudomonas yamanorum TaxID=515393 RepID=UPI0015A13B8D|nr:hypothetical protein [Pseudomonas yamanorum]NWD26870.1 hypothetical protein [Pseudomonas yamanorum]
MVTLNIPEKDVTGFIRTLAKRYGVDYVESRFDKVAQIITRLAGDDVKPDDVEGLLINLNRKGWIASSDMMVLHSRYLDETHAAAKYAATR